MSAWYNVDLDAVRRLALAAVDDCRRGMGPVWIHLHPQGDECVSGCSVTRLAPWGPGGIPTNSQPPSVVVTTRATPSVTPPGPVEAPRPPGGGE